MLANKGDLDSSIQEYESALKIDPRQEVALFNVAEVYALSGKKDKAAETLRRLLAINPDDSEVREKLARLEGR